MPFLISAIFVSESGLSVSDVIVLSSVVFGGDQPVAIVDDVGDNGPNTYFSAIASLASNEHDRALLGKIRARVLAFASTDLWGSGTYLGTVGLGLY